MNRTTSVAAALAEYTIGAEGWDLLVFTESKSANAIFDRLRALARVLRDSPAGRAGLVGLAAHDQAGVRLLAASELLSWDAEAAVPVLEKLELQDTLHAVSAKYTLRSYRSGTLRRD